MGTENHRRRMARNNPLPASRGAVAAARGPALRILLATLVCLLFCLPLLPLREARAGDTVYLEVGGQNRYDNYSTAWMYADGQIVYCALPELATPAEGAYAKEPLDDNLHSSWREVVRAMLFYGYGGPGFDPSRYWPQAWYDGTEMTDARYAALTHILISEAFSRSTESPSLYGCSEEFVTWVQGEVIGMQGDSGPWKADTIGGALRNSGLSGEYGEWFDSVMPDVFGTYMLRTGEGSQIVVSYTPYGYIELSKASSDTRISRANESYTLEGARYAVFDAGGKRAATLVTDSAGYARSDALAPGTYTVREELAPAGFALGVRSFEVSVPKGASATLDVSDTPQRSQVELVIQKVDAETGSPAALGAATLSGAQFEVAYYAASSQVEEGGEPTRSWVVATDDEGKACLDAAHLVSGDELYADESGGVLPLGTVTIRETKAPRGYLIDPTVHTVRISSDTDEVYVSKFEARKSSDQAIRGDIDLLKVHGQSMARLAGIPFKVMSTTTGEAHVLVTDENGYASTSSSWNPHSQSTNANDWLLEGGTQEGRVPDPSAGVWFGLGTPANDALGALPFDTYIVTELPCEANEGLGLVDMRVVVTRNGYTIPLGTVDDNDGPRIGTTLTDETGSHLAAASERIRLIDRVAYENLSPEATYTLIGTLVDSSTGEALSDESGAPIGTTVEFEPTMSAGTQDVVFEFDAAALGGVSLVAFEELQVDGRTVAVHEDLEDEGQTVWIPRIKTSAQDATTHAREVWASESVAIEDVIAYEGLIPGKTYAVEGVLMDKTTGVPATNPDGGELHAATEFVAERERGTVTVTFEFDGTHLAGHELVAFETLEYEGVEYAAHADLEDERQTVSLPRISTSARDAADGDRTLRCAPGQHIVDAVAYEGLKPGGSYVLAGTVYDDGGNVLTASRQAFTPTEPDGSVDVAFEIDGLGQEAHTAVVFEELYHEDVLVATHCDPDAEAQTLRFPSLRTQAVDPRDADQVIVAAADARIIDRVSYAGLMVDEAYVLRGTLMDKESGQALCDMSGRPIEAIASFIARSEDGEAEVAFKFDGRGLEGRCAVVFEQLDNRNELVARHADLNDAAQTVVFEAPPTPPTPPTPATPSSHGVAKTGDDARMALALAAALGLAGVACAAAAAQLRRRGRHSSR